MSLYYRTLTMATARPFVLQIDTTKGDGLKSFLIPTRVGEVYNYAVKVYDSTNQLVFSIGGRTGNYTIDLTPYSGTMFDVHIAPKKDGSGFPSPFFNNAGDTLKVVDIKQWGDIVWGVNQTQSYSGASNVTCTATNSPNMLAVTNGLYMFQNATNFNPPNFAPTLANLTNGRYMFQNATNFNPPNFAPTLVNLTNGQHMFQNATNFNPPNFAPTLANLTNGRYMFYGCTVFSQEIYAPNSIYLVDDTQMFNGTKIAKITMNNTSLTTSEPDTFKCTLLTDLILTDRKVDLRISYSPLLTGAKIDALANSVADMTGYTSPNVTMTLAQRASCDQSLWTNKNWTIIAV